MRVFDRASGSSSRDFHYTFARNSNLITRVETPAVGSGNWIAERLYRPHDNNLLSTSTSVSGQSQALVEIAFSGYDSVGRLTDATFSGARFAGFGAGDSLSHHCRYSESGRLVGLDAKVLNASGLPVDLPSRSFEFQYDDSGNREWSKQTDTTADFTRVYDADVADGYQAITDPMRDVLTGSVATNSWFKDQEQNTYHWTTHRPGGGDVFEHDFDTTVGSPNADTAMHHRLFYFNFGNPPVGWQRWAYPPRLQSPVYDKDGNLTFDGLFSYTYDLENRLVSVMSQAADYMGFKYDYMGRRVEAVFWDYEDGDWIERWTRRYVYDGWHLVAELDVTGGNAAAPVTNTYFWGYDISHTIGGAGTIGGLLLVDDGTEQYLPAFDGRGDLVVLANAATGAIAAQFEYGPYGQTLSKSGALDKIPFRYQTKWDLDYLSEGVTWMNWNLIDYGLRWYQPHHGRFLNRDPLGEAGGLNLYEAFGGDPINRYDYLGLMISGIQFGVFQECWYEDTMECTDTEEGFICEVKATKVCDTEPNDFSYIDDSGASSDPTTYGGPSDGLDSMNHGGSDHPPHEEDQEREARKKRCDDIKSELDQNALKWGDLNNRIGALRQSQANFADSDYNFIEGVENSIIGEAASIADGIGVVANVHPLTAVVINSAGVTQSASNQDYVGLGLATGSTLVNLTILTTSPTSSFSAMLSAGAKGTGIAGIFITAGKIIVPNIWGELRSISEQKKSGVWIPRRISHFEGQIEDIKASHGTLIDEFVDNNCKEFY